MIRSRKLMPRPHAPRLGAGRGTGRRLGGLALLAILSCSLHAQTDDNAPPLQKTPPPRGTPGSVPLPADAVRPPMALPALPASTAAPVAVIQPSRAGADAPVSLNFVNADIDSVVRAIGKVSGRSFVIDPRVKGTVNIVSSKPVAPALTYDILLSALRVQGFAAVESNGLTLIVPEADAKLHYSGAGRGSGDRIVTEVIVVEHESAAQLLPVLKPLISPNNNIAAYAANNTLVITDYAENVRKIRQIVEAVDRVSTPEPLLIQLRHASVVELAPLLTRLLGDAPPITQAGVGDVQRRILLIPDLRSNSLLVQAPGAARLARLRQLIDQLDVPAASGGNMHVVYLKNAEATKLAQTLRAILTGDTSAPTSGGAGAGASLSSPTAAASSLSSTGASGSYGGGRAAASEASTPGIVQADAATNSLIITAPEPTFNMLRAVIEKLDMRRAQVFVEALIAEVSAEKATEWGVQWNTFGGVGGGQTRVVGGTNFGGIGTNIIGIAQNPAIAGPGLNLGIARGQITLPGVGTITNLNALARALESDERTNILSTPNLLTLDSEEARIVVGQNVPFVTGSYAQTGTTTTPSPFQTIERKDVGLMLKVKPQITEGGAVRMQVFQEVSSVEETTRNQSAGPTTNKRSLESTVVVDDGDFIVLGGLIQDSLVRSASKVPWLGDLPLVGWLFRYENEQRVKTNLMVFLRPVIVRNFDSSHKIAADRYDYLIGEQKALTRQANTLFSNEGIPQLPERDGVTGLPPSPGMPPPDASGRDEMTPGARPRSSEAVPPAEAVSPTEAVRRDAAPAPTAAQAIAVPVAAAGETTPNKGANAQPQAVPPPAAAGAAN
jgi:general secretion pathway protein D